MEKNRLPENQRITAVSLNNKGREVLERIKKKQLDVFGTVTASLGLSAKQDPFFKKILENSICYFDDRLGLGFDEPSVVNS